jgi:hypothetical protein
MLQHNPSKQYYNLRWKSKSIPELATIVKNMAGSFGMKATLNFLLGAHSSMVSGIF